MTRKGERETTRRGLLGGLLRSVRLSIFLLILLALTSILGTLIKQNAPTMEYIHRFGPGLYQFLNFLGLFDMYHSWWFRGILVLLAINIISCSSTRFPRIWRTITRPKAEMDPVRIASLPNVKRLRRSVSLGEAADKAFSIAGRMLGKPLRWERPEATVIFAEKGSMSRLGAYITHLSILVILSGSLIGSLFGFKGFVNIPEGKAVDRVFTRDRGGTGSKSLGFEVRCDDFRITYYDVNPQERLVKEYISTLSFYQDGREVMKREVRVNHPLTFNGLHFYQSSYGSIPEVTVRVENQNEGRNFSLVALEGERVRIPGSEAFFEILRYHPQIHDFGEGVAVVMFKPKVMPQRFWLLKVRPKLVGGYQFTFTGVTEREYTGLQITRDPGIWAVWTGCVLLVLGLVVAFFFSHQRTWILIPKGKATILVSGTANKNRMAFEKRLDEVVAALEGEV